MLQTIINSFDSFLTQSPNVFWSIIVFFLGIMAWGAAQKIVINFLDKIKFRYVLKGLGVEKALARTDINLDITEFFGKVAGFLFFIFFLMTACEIIGLNQLSSFLASIIAYYPNILISCLIAIITVFATNFSQKIVIGTLEEKQITYSHFLGRAIRWSIWFFAVLAIFYQLKIAPDIFMAIFLGLVITISLIIGISFGFGGKDLAAKILKEMEEKLK